jgi:hypothetical protein
MSLRRRAGAWVCGAVAAVLLLWLVRDDNPEPFSDHTASLTRIKVTGRFFREYAATYGVFPDPREGLWQQQLVDAGFPPEPFEDKAGRPLRVAVLEASGRGTGALRVWSVGADGINQGGNGDDVGFSLMGHWPHWTFGVNHGHAWAKRRAASWWWFGLGAVALSGAALVRRGGSRSALLVCGAGAIAAGGWCFDGPIWGSGRLFPHAEGFEIALVSLWVCFGVIADRVLAWWSTRSEKAAHVRARAIHAPPEERGTA